MKRVLILALSAVLALPPAFGVEVTAEFKASSFAMTKDGDFDPGTNRYGGAFSVSDRLTPNLFGYLAFDNDPVYGSMLSARGMYRTSYMEISAGPAFGVLNGSEGSDGVTMLFQPGLGIGFKLTVPGVLVASADTEFALPAAVQTDGQVYLQKNEISAGFFLPNVLCTVKVSQKNASLLDGGAGKIRSSTDYGLYTTAYKKGSMFRISMNFVYRIIDYFVAQDYEGNRKVANLVLGGGFTVTPRTEYSLFVDGSGALYSFSLGSPETGLDRFMFDLRAGVSLSLDRPTTGEAGK